MHLLKLFGFQSSSLENHFIFLMLVSNIFYFCLVLDGKDAIIVFVE